MYVVGAGAVGTFLGEALSAGGADVVYAPRRLEDVTETRCDLAIVAVKAFATQSAIATLERALPAGSEATIVTPQNGVGNEELLAAAFGADRIVSGALTVPVEWAGDRGVAAVSGGGLALAPVGSPAHNWLLATFERTGMPVTAAADYRALKWSKLALNIVANASCAILDVLPADIVAHRDLFAYELAAVREIRAVMRGFGLAPLDLPRYPVRALFKMAALPGGLGRALLGGRIARARGSKPPSLVLDMRAGRATEIGALNGAVAAAAARLGLRAPLNATYARLVDAAGADSALRDRYRHDAARLAEDLRAASAAR